MNPRPRPHWFALGLLLALAPLTSGRGADPSQAPGPGADRPSVTPAAPLPDGAAEPVPAPRVVILVRHAEKQAGAEDPRDPPLSAEGAVRAGELARLLAASGASALFASEYQRTRATLGPLSAAVGAAVKPVGAAKLDDLAAELDALAAGSVAVVCGHSNTLPRIAERLGVELARLVDFQGGRALADESYDRLFVITRPAVGPAQVLEFGYGAPSGATASSGR